MTKFKIATNNVTGAMFEPRDTRLKIVPTAEGYIRQQVIALRPAG